MFIKTIRVMKREVTERKKIFIIQLPNKRILSTIFTQIYKNYRWIKKNKKTIQSVRHFPKEDTQMAHKPMKMCSTSVVKEKQTENMKVHFLMGRKCQKAASSTGAHSECPGCPRTISHTVTQCQNASKEIASLASSLRVRYS